MKASVEQSKILEAIINNHNVIVDAVAGSGKTTTSFLISEQMKDKKILILTYNRRLMDEGKVRIPFKHVDIRTYHSFASTYFKKGYTDMNLEFIIDQDVNNIKPYGYDLFILDEQQDMTPLLFKLTKKIFKHNNIDNPQICVFGDKYQTIYDYKGADCRYLTLADKLYPSQYEWVRLNLSTSYRLTPSNAEFINKCVLKYDRIIPGNKGFDIKPTYMIGNLFSDIPDRLADLIDYYIKEKNYSYNDIFVISPTVRSNNGRFPLNILENKLVRRGHLCYAPSSDNVGINSKCSANKILFSTFHSTKGLERKIVIVYSMDSNYYNFGCNEDQPKNVCPCPIYVAMTRVIEKLIIVHGNDKDYLPFIDKSLISTYTNITGHIKKIKYSETKNKLSVTDILRFLDPVTEKTALSMVNYKEEKLPKLAKIDLPSEVETSTGFEYVSDIIGTAITMLHKNPTYKIKDIFKKSLKNITYTNKWISRLNQIDNYDWITDAKAKKIISRMDKVIGTNNSYEIECTIDDINGIVDIIDSNNCIWEIKCTSTIETVHILQLAMYAYIMGGRYTYKLYNPILNQMYTISYTSDLKNMVYYIINQKYKKRMVIDDDTFLNCK